MTGGIIRVGISGWTHASWRGGFYPNGLRRERELAYAASHVRTIEINSTFYSLHRPEAFAGWAQQVAADFVFAVRAPRVITHIRRLRDVETALANFIASGLLRLGVHLGPILWQFPSNFCYERARLEAFLRLLPHDTVDAALLGRKHDATLPTTPWLKVESVRPLRHAFEVRHESFRCVEFIELLRAHDVALVCADAARWPSLMDVTSDFVYCRLHGSAGRAEPGYDNDALDRWVRRLKAWSSGSEPEDAERIGGKARRRKRDVVAVFDSATKLRAPVNAMELIRRLRS